MIALQRHTDYSKNARKAGDLQPCVICGRAIKAEQPAQVHVHKGGTHIVTETEAADLGPAADMDFSPIGPCCLKRHPELKGYTR